MAKRRSMGQLVYCIIEIVTKNKKRADIVYLRILKYLLTSGRVACAGSLAYSKTYKYLKKCNLK